MHDVHTRDDDDEAYLNEPEAFDDETADGLEGAESTPDAFDTEDSQTPAGEPAPKPSEAAAAPADREEPRVSSRAKGIRVPGVLDRAVRDEMKRRGVTEWSTMVVELVDEALRMRRAPGVVFVDGPVGRRPVIAGTGLDVWEVIATWQDVGRDYRRLRAAYEWLTEPQLRAALSYYESYAREIDDRLERERELTPEEAQAAFPFIRAR